MMKGNVITEKIIQQFEIYLKMEEKSQNTIEKYIRDVKAFAEYVGEMEITKEISIEYKLQLQSSDYAIRSINSIIASINKFFEFIGKYECRLKIIKLQRQIYCPEEKELTRAEYERLVRTAKQKGNERLNLIIQTICGTGICVSELPFIRSRLFARVKQLFLLKEKQDRFLL